MLATLLAPLLLIGQHTRDEQVVQAAMLSLFHASSWTNTAGKGEFIVIADEYGHLGKGFSASARSLADWVEERAKDTGGIWGSPKAHERATKEAALLRELAKSSDPDPESLPKQTPLREMTLDPRIVVDSSKMGKGLLSPGTEQITNRLGETGTIRAVAILQPPVYSRDGGHAILWTAGFRNAADFIYLLNLDKGNWKVQFAFEGIYLD